jgi:hypothetical protein
MSAEILAFPRPYRDRLEVRRGIDRDHRLPVYVLDLFTRDDSILLGVCSQSRKDSIVNAWRADGATRVVEAR